MSDPFLIEQPFVVSFSGGRTSGYMLRRILDAYGGKMPEGGKVVFANTGKERLETLDFVERVSQRWDVEIVWLEFRAEEPRFARVDYATASRNGEPFTMAIRKHSFLPNPVTRFCTVDLKIRTSIRFCKSLGWEEWTNCVGLRADEPNRVAKLKGDVKAEGTYCPLAKADIRLSHVRDFWNAHPFDLDLRPDEGNCDLCFLKGQSKLAVIIRERPQLAEWWAEREREPLASKPSGARFRQDRPSYANLLKQVQEQPEFAFPEDESLTTCYCTD